MNRFTELINQAAEAIERDPADIQPSAAAEEPVTATSTDGRVRAVVSRHGRLLTVDIEPSLLRTSLADAMESAREAVNAAFAAARGDLDLSGAAEMIAQLQDQASRQLSMITGSLADLEARVRAERAGTR